MPEFTVPSAARRLFVPLAAALVAMLVGTASVSANEPGAWVLPEDDGALRVPAVAPRLGDESAAGPADREPQPSEPVRAAPSAAPTPGPVPDPVGIDISYPQCGRAYPESFGFAVVGVNGGRVFSPNPCFGPGGDDPSQLEWAGPDAELYFNTGNPGPRLSSHWPVGETEPRACPRRVPGRDSVDCAYVYGWMAAMFAHGQALEAYIELGWADAGAEQLPEETTIWLDVEPANSWRRDRELNVAALEGAVAYLESVEVERIGFYSTPRLWDRITGGTDRFADYPAWHAGARDRTDAERRCEQEPAFTGGELAMVQWVEGDLDHNVRCEPAEPPD